MERAVADHGTRARAGTRPPTRRIVVLAVLAALVLAVAGCDSSQVTLSGTVYRDLDGDGVRDAGEPGVAGLKVFLGSAPDLAATTSDTGAWSLTAPASSSTIQIGTGWFRGGCGSRYCSADANGWEVVNQVTRLPVPDASSSGRDVGLVPDWPGGISSIPSPVDGVVPANGVDLAARLSTTGDSGCKGGTRSICGPGASLWYVAQIQNQGTEDVTGVVAAVSIPDGDCLTGVTFQPSTAPDGTALTVEPATFSCATRAVLLRLSGVLPAGSQARVMLAGRVAGGPGTPGCTSSPTATCSTVEPQGRSWKLAIEQADQPDVEGPRCVTFLGPAFCASGIHDKRYEPDDVDVAGHNVPAAAGDPTTFNLQPVSLSVSTAPGGGFRPGADLRFRTIAVNTGPAASSVQVNAGWTVRTYFPAGTGLLDWPGRITTSGNSNPIVGCTATASAGAAPLVTCAGRGPIPASVASVAMDLTVSVPTTWPSGTPFRAVSCVAPAQGQAGETVPGGTCSASTDPRATATDNDTDTSVSIG